ncbi:MAG TPA: chemotaxis protein, partial [Agrobacterium sp.]|nr:chemotaxis protein [Agrobacterium sp.]
MFLKTATARNMFAIVFAGVLTTVATAGVLLWLSYRAVEERSISEMHNAANTSAANVETFFAHATTLGANMRSALHTEKETGNPSRESIDRLFKRLLQDSPFAVGISTGWEPNAFDGRDKEFANAPGHDATGRFVPYYARKDGKVIEEALVDYETPGAGDYYLVPRRTGKDLMTEPYVYPINGKDVFMTSFMAPLMFDGKFGGVIGVDIALDSLSSDLAKLKPLGEGYIALLSKDGSIVSHPDTRTHG